MRTFMPALVMAAVATVASAQSASTSTSSPAASDTTSLPAELAAIAECNTTQLDAAQVTLTSNQRADQCEKALSLQAGTMLQVTTDQAAAMCDTASCRAALQELYNVLPNCRYNLWGLQFSAKQLLEHCGITPTNSTGTNLSGNISDTSSFAPVGAIGAPATAGNTTADSPTPAQVSSTSTLTTALSVVVAASVIFATALLA